MVFEPVMVESEGFEPSSKHGTNYAFYMLSKLLVCREGEGQLLACTVFLRCFISPGNRTAYQASSVGPPETRKV